MRYTTTVTFLLILISVFTLASCAVKPVKEIEPVGWQQRQAALAAIDQWKMRSRIGIRSKQASGSATLIWDEKTSERQLRLIGPLGGGVIHLQQDSTGASIKDSKGKTWQAHNAGNLIYSVTGWRIPVSGLRWWLLGMTEPGSEADYTLDDSMRLQSIKQDGWTVTLNRYAMFGKYELPASILVETDAEKDSEFYARVKLIVKEWTIKD